MPNDIEQLKQDFLRYINFLQFLSPEILVDKVSSISQNKLSKIEIKHNNEKILFIETKNKKCHLTKNDLGKYGLSVEDFRKGIEDIKSKDPKKIFSAAVEEIIILHNKKLCEIYIPSTILIYTELYEKFKLAYPNTDRYRIYHLIDVTIENSLTDKSSLTYNYFKRAYQGYANPQGFAAIFNTINLETEKNLNTIFNITKKLQINFTHYQTSYTTLTDLIEELYICAEDKTATKVLIDNLKFHTNICFSNLIQASSEKHAKKIVFTKTTIEKFKSAIQELIKDYIEDHPDECKKQLGILDRILWFIAKIIPSSILSEDRKMTLFYTPSGIQIKNLNDQIKSIVQQHFVY